jgi:hypothetical protein
MGSPRYLLEEVVGFQEPLTLTMRVVETNLPFSAAVDIRFDLEEQGGGSRVSVSPTYQLEYGPFGRLADRMMIHPTYRRGMEVLLAGLRGHLEDNTASRPSARDG